MKKVYLVKKDPAKPAGDDNWIIMNSYEFAQFIKTEDGRARRSGFGQLDACTTDDCVIIAECGSCCAKEWRAAKDEHDYLAEMERKSTYITFSYNALEVNGEDMSGEEFLLADECDVELTVIEKVTREELVRALGSLDEEERLLIKSLFLAKKPMTETEFARKHGLKQPYVNYHKAKALKKLKKIMEGKN